jgi:hypothetical protein
LLAVVRALCRMTMPSSGGVFLQERLRFLTGADIRECRVFVGECFQFLSRLCS